MTAQGTDRSTNAILTINEGSLGSFPRRDPVRLVSRPELIAYADEPVISVSPEDFAVGEEALRDCLSVIDGLGHQGSESRRATNDAAREEVFYNVRLPLLKMASRGKLCTALRRFRALESLAPECSGENGVFPEY